MVKTRNSGQCDGDDELPDDYVTILSRNSSNRTEIQSQEINGYESDESEELSVEPVHRHRSKRVLIDFEDDNPHGMTTRNRHGRDVDDSAERVSESRMPRYSTRSRETRHILEVSPSDYDIQNGGIRRSTRQRKLTYDTFNQTVIDKHFLAMIDHSEIEDQGDKMHQYKRKRRGENSAEDNQDGLDMYTRVKRERKKMKRDIYGLPIQEDGGKGSMEEESDAKSPEEKEEDTVEEEPQGGRSYYLREHRPRVNLYEAPPIEPQRRLKNMDFFRDSPPRHIQDNDSYRSPARRKRIFKSYRKHRAFHGSDTTSSSSDDEGCEDERRFERQKAKSMAKARQRCLPMNMTAEEMAAGVLRDRAKIGGSLADVDPMNIDKSITFESVGGLNKHIRALKEMIVFPLLYPEVFEMFKIQPPRGVLFYGPPGTGKTLLARALANECSKGERRVALYMRKGADCLSKWVGESERQLRLLFDQAYQSRPSIIFFDEIDGLAPVRCSRQDQIHSSIVSTLLALMDGLDNRGEIVVIGATNRIDSIDPALRRPGRFDRELLFPLPSVMARQQILQIHTKEWNPKLSNDFLLELAEKCVGYCGADLRAVCTEAALQALRRRYPQIYTSEEKLELDVNSIQISAKDFYRAMQTIVPTSLRSVTSPARALAPAMKPLLQGILSRIITVLKGIFPDVCQFSGIDNQDPKVTAQGTTTTLGVDTELYSDDDDTAAPIFEDIKNKNSLESGTGVKECSRLNSYSCRRPATCRPRLLLAGKLGQGQSTHLGPALLHYLERMPVHMLDLPALFAASSKTPEESCAQIFREARRTCPSIIYLPHIEHWWDVIGETLRATFLTLLLDMESTAPVLFIATSEQTFESMPDQLQNLFRMHDEAVNMRNPTARERKAFFEDLFLVEAKKPPPTRKQAAEIMLEVLPKAKPPEPRELTDSELKRLRKQEEITLRELRLFLRDVLNRLARDRKFGIFAKPVDEEEVTDYYEIIQQPMDLSTMMSKIDLYKYITVDEFLDDINLICSNALEYNPDRDPSDRAIRHRACALRDTAHAIIAAELDTDFEKLCNDIKESRKKRGGSGDGPELPSYYFTKNNIKTGLNILGNALPEDYPSRFSRRVRGMEASSPSVSVQEEKTEEESATTENCVGQADDGTSHTPKYRLVVKKIRVPRNRSANRNNISPWCRASHRRRFKKVFVYVDENGVEVPADEVGKENSEMGCDQVNEEVNEQNTAVVPTSPKSQKSVDKDGLCKTENALSEDEEVSVETNKGNSPAVSPCIVTRSSPRAKLNSCSPTVKAATSPTTKSNPGNNSIKATSSTSPRDAQKSVTLSEKTDIHHREGANVKTKRRRSQSGTGTESDMDLLDTSRGNIKQTSPQQVLDTSRGNIKQTSPQPVLDTPRGNVKHTSPQQAPNPDRSAFLHAQEFISSVTKQKGLTSPDKPCDNTTCKTTMETGSCEVNKHAVEYEKPALRPRRLTSEQPVVEPPVIIDEDKLRYLLAQTLQDTDGYNVEDLEYLHSRLALSVYSHRTSYDRTHLLQDLEEILNQLVII